MCDEYTPEEFSRDALFAVLSETENVAKVGGWEWDVVENKWTFSDNWLRLHGLRRHHLETSELLDIAHPDDRLDIQKALDEAIAEGADYEIEHRIIRQDTGEERYIKVFGRGRTNSDGKVVKIYGAAQDITERKQARAEIERMQYSIDMISDCVFWVGEAGIFLNVNEAACRNLGYSRDELMSMGVADIDPNYGSEKWPSHWEEMKRCRVMKIETTHRTKDGRSFPVEAVIHNQKFGGIHYNCVLARDITERKQAEQELIENEALFRGMFNDHSAVMLLIDPATGQIIQANQAAGKYYGYPLEEMLQMNIDQVNISPPEEVAEKIRLASSKQTNVFEFQHLLADGQVRDVEVHSTPITVLHRRLLFSIIRDITERKRAEEALQKSLSRYDELAANVPVGVYVFWIRVNGHLEFEFVSDRWCEIHQIKREDVLSDVMRVDSQVHPDEQDDFSERNRESFRNRIPFSWEGRFLVGDGQLRWLSIESTPIVFDNGDIRWFGVTADITERKQIEEDRKKLRYQLSQVEKAESLGRMAGAVAHHFNNQLSAVMGNLELFLDDLPADAKNRENLFQAFGAAKKAADQSRQMLRYLGLITGNKTAVNLSDVCCQSLPLLQSTTTRGVTLNVDLPDSGPFIHCDAGQVQQILANLVTNAQESLPENRGSIGLMIQTVSHEFISTTNRFPPDWQPQDIPYACLEISDTGCGISEEDMNKLFDPFFSTKFTGRGMGLSVAMGSLKNHGGCITIDSEPGRGSVFRVYLPVSGEEIVEREK